MRDYHATGSGLSLHCMEPQMNADAAGRSPRRCLPHSRQTRQWISTLGRPNSIILTAEQDSFVTKGNSPNGPARFHDAWSFYAAMQMLRQFDHIDWFR
jgi:hypothetical protein